MLIYEGYTTYGYTCYGYTCYGYTYYGCTYRQGKRVLLYEGDSDDCGLQTAPIEVSGGWA